MKEGCDNVSIDYGEKDGYWMDGTYSSRKEDG